MMTINILEIVQVLLFIVVFVLSKTSNLFKRRIEILFFALLTSFIYVTWRMLYTIPHTSLLAQILGWTLFGAELLGLIDTIPFYMIIWGFHRQKVPLVSSGFNWPSVDIFIATYNESPELLKRTVWACKALEYPAKAKVKIYLCDDGHRSGVKELAKQLEIGYLTRNGNEGAKAGNLNNAMMLTEGQLIVTLDADMIPSSKFLLRTVPFMQDIDVGFVQTPQAFYNEDILRYDLFLSNVMPDEQDFFNRVVQTGRSAFNASIYSGSNTLFRRHAIDSIGGFVTGTITEDFATGMMIQAKGWKSKYLNEVLAVGLSPETMEDLIQQRVRWGRGVVQTFKKYNPLTMKGLTFSQRVLYLNSLTYWFSGLFRYAYFGAPLVYGLFGLVIFTANPISIVAIWFTNFLASRVVFNTIVGKYSTTFWRNAFDTVLFPHISSSVLKELFFGKSNLKFKVTPKDKVKSNKATYKASLIRVQIVLSFLSVLAVVNLSRHEWGHYQSHDLAELVNDGVNLFWVIYNLALLLVSLFVVRELPRKRGSDRFDLPSNVLVTRGNGATIEGTIDNISETGISVKFSSGYVLPSEEVFTLELRPHATHHIKSSVFVNSQIISYEKRGDSFFCALKFVDLDETTKESLTLYLFNRKDIVATKHDPDFGYLSFVSRYAKTTQKLGNAVHLSRKSPRLDIVPSKRVLFTFMHDGMGLSYEASNINHSHVLVRGKTFLPTVQMTTFVDKSTYSLDLVFEREVTKDVGLYRLQSTDHSLIEGWFNHVSEVQQFGSIVSSPTSVHSGVSVGDSL